MDAEWIKSPTARRILMHWADPRPAWLWSHDGLTLLWRNRAARYFNSRVKKHGLRLSPEAVPIKGQVARLIRLGGIGRSSLSRLQFLAGDKPVSTTCACTPLTLKDGEVALLLVGVDQIPAELLRAAPEAPADRMTETLFPAGADYLMFEDGAITTGSGRALAEVAPMLEGAPPPEGDAILIGGDLIEVTRFKASPGDAILLLFGGRATASRIEQVRMAEGEAIEPAEARAATRASTPTAEPMLPMELPQAPGHDEPASARDEWVEPLPQATQESLVSLFDRLAEDSGLYTSLSAADEVFKGPEAAVEDMIAAIIEYEGDARDETPSAPPRADDESAADPESAAEPDTPLQWRITGRGFFPLPEPEPEEKPAEPPMTVDTAPDLEAAERVSRYNFEELGRILTDRVSGETQFAPHEEPVEAAKQPSSDGVINLNAETLVLNRVPLGIIVFRDQQVLFANRALTEMLGYEGVQSLRAAGIGAIFPVPEGNAAGPITHLLKRDGLATPVEARLQSVTWQGKAALMLSAAIAEPRFGHEGAVRAFAEIAAEAREEGFVAADRAGVVTLVSGHGRVLLGTAKSELMGRPLTALIAPEEHAGLRAFLERPARFAETARPSLVASGYIAGIELVLFAEGEAGIVTGYFGFLRKRQPMPLPAGSDEALEPSMLGRLSRGIRRPLNTIIGFADMIRTAEPGTIEAQRTIEYARDIKMAGGEIAVLVDELDDFARLRDGRYEPRTSDIDLMALLESCMVRVKAQAGAARVLVRSAISERLPRIRADRASLGQAVLNLLASAVGETPAGGSVILSAQWDEGGIAVHVRDGSLPNVDIGERFVVFRDGTGKDGEQLAPVRSSVGLALTRSLLAVNACSLSVDPTAGVGTLFSLMIPAESLVLAP